MKAIILAGGYGTRLKRLIYDRPKSMATIAGIPFLEHQIRLLKDQGINDIILCVAFMADKIKSYFGDGKKIGVNITYSEEEVPLGTAGAIKKAEQYINETFLVVNGDAYSQIDLQQFLDFHRSRNSQFTMSLTPKEDPGHYESVKLEGDKVTEFLENKSENMRNVVNSGAYIFEPSIFNHIEPDKNSSLERQLLPDLAKAGKLCGYNYNGYHIDIGLPETYHQFKADVLTSLCLSEGRSVRDAMNKINKSGIRVVLIVNAQNKLLGLLTDKDVVGFVIRGGDLNEMALNIANKSPVTVNENFSKDDLEKLHKVGIEYVPVIDQLGTLKDIEFYEEETEAKSFPVVRGRAPLRVSFAGGGTDLPYFFNTYGGMVISATINKYCHATIIKRADKRILIRSDTAEDISVNSLEELNYDGRLDLVKAAIKVMNPQFGLEVYIHNDVPPGGGLGSSASLSSLLISMLNEIMETKYNDYKIAELALQTEREELKIKGGWQDQYATVTGGFNFMEFAENKSIVYPLKLKKEVIDELESHCLLCYVGKVHASGEIHEEQERAYNEDKSDKVMKLTKLKELTVEIKESLLTNHLETFGRLLNETWKIKRSLSSEISNTVIDRLYEEGMKNGAYGGRLLGAGDGGYILFFYSPRKRNDLVKALETMGGKVTSFSFESEGARVWKAKSRF